MRFLFALLSLLPFRTDIYTVSDIYETEPHVWHVEICHPNGTEYKFDAEDWCDVFPGDLVSATLYTKWTTSVMDDEIVAVNTSWYFEY